MNAKECHTIALPTVLPTNSTGHTPHLLVTAGPLEGREYTVNKLPYTIGSGLSNDLSIADSTVSRHHCEIDADEQGNLLIRDLGSTNGTSVGGVKVAQARLVPNTEVRLGRSALLVPLVREQQALTLSAREQFGRSVGRTPIIRHAFYLAEQAAACEKPVLILGESGTGKEELARDIHRESARAEAPFIVIDCNAFDTLEAAKRELFGDERSPGVLALAGGGTLFVDSLSRLPAEAQPLLLRAVETRQDIRFIAASKEPLGEMAKRGAFSQPLYLAMAVIVIDMPALRRRRDDIPLLARSLAERLQVNEKLSAWLEQPATLAFLGRYAWPGNIRELRTLLARLAALDHIPADIGAFLHENAAQTEGATLPGGAGHAGGSDETLHISADRPFKDLKNEFVEAFERKYLSDLLARNAQNVSQSARSAGIERAYLQRLIRKYGMRSE